MLGSMRRLIVTGLIPVLAIASGFGLVCVSFAAPEAAAAAPASLPRVRLEDDDLRMLFGGSWSTEWSSTSSGQTHRLSRTSGAWARASFEGTSAALVSSLGPNRGRARIYVDGVEVATVDLYASVYSRPKVVWKSSELPLSTHTVKVVVAGTRSAASSATYVALDALDFTGTVPAQALSGTIVNNTNSKLAKWGYWWVSSQPSAIGGSALRAHRRGNTLTMRFKGTRFAWIGTKSSGCGRAVVYLDGKRVATVSQYRPSSATRRVAYARSGLTYGVHEVTIRVLGSPSTGTGTRVDVDAFQIDGTPLKAYSPTPFDYPWKTYILIDKSSFRLHWVKNGHLIRSYPIAHGRPSMPTPSRVWRIGAKYYTDPSSVYGPRKMRMFRRIATSRGYVYEYTRYAIHGTNEPWVIGTLASHGCIRMYNRHVLELFPQVPLYTMVVTRD